MPGPGFIEQLGNLVKSGEFAVAESRKTRMPLLLARRADAFGSDGASSGMTFTRTDPQDLARIGPAGVGLAALSKAYGGNTPVALIAAGKNPVGDINEVVLHESIHGQVDKDFPYNGIMEMDEDAAYSILSKLSPAAQKIRKEVEKDYDSRDNPQRTIGEMIAFTGSRKTEGDAQALYEINRFMKEEFGWKHQPLQPVVNMATGEVNQQVNSKMSFDQMLGKLQQNVQPVGVLQMMRGGR